MPTSPDVQPEIGFPLWEVHREVRAGQAASILDAEYKGI